MRPLKVLLAWELGGSRGHLYRLFEIGRRLAKAGHHPVYALQRLAPDALQFPVESEIWQAPVSPRLLGHTTRGDARPPATLGDILARLGFGDPGIVAGWLRAWDHLLGAIRPDVIVVDYAPMVLVAARGRIPTLACGNGFDAPPLVDRFPSLNGKPAAYDEVETLAAFNEGLVETGRAPLATLSAIFAADRQHVGAFAELDPYDGHRTVPLLAPTVSAPRPAPTGAQGAEVFAYVHETVPITSPLWEGLRASGLPVRTYVPALTPAFAAALRQKGFAVEHQPQGFADIARRSRLILSHGSHGFVSSGLLAGIPQVTCFMDLEKMQTGIRTTKLGVGGHVALAELRSEPFARSLVQAYESREIAARALALAPDFQARMSRNVEDEAVGTVEQLACSTA